MQDADEARTEAYFAVRWRSIGSGNAVSMPSMKVGAVLCAILHVLNDSPLIRLQIGQNILKLITQINLIANSS